MKHFFISFKVSLQFNCDFFLFDFILLKFINIKHQFSKNTGKLLIKASSKRATFPYILLT